MERIYKDYQDKNVEIVLLYSREPHPGKRYPQPATLEERMAHAQEFQRIHQVSHPIWVDDMDNTVRALYGARPNMVYIVDKRGLIIYKSTWTVPEDIEGVLANLWEREQAQAHGVTLRPTYSERTTYRPLELTVNIERVGLPILEDAPGELERVYGEEYAQVVRKRAHSR